MRSLFKSRKAPSPNEDVLEQLANYEVIILMDDSMSMRGKRWKQAGEVMQKVVEKAVQYDRNGIEIRFLNDRRTSNVMSKKEVKELFKDVYPEGFTPLGKRLGNICEEYMKRYTVSPGLKRCLIVVITDGAPDDEDRPLVFSNIKKTAKQLHKSAAPIAQLGIQFVQIGEDRWASRFLKELDDDLKGDTKDKVPRDIVDTVPYNGKELDSDDMIKILAGAINRKVDKQQNRPQ